MITLFEGDNQLNVALTPIAVPVATLYGTVTDAATGLAIQGVKVEIDGLITYTDANGFYSFVGLSLGSYTILFTKEGYQSWTR